MPNSNLFTHRLLFFSREATSEIYDPRVSCLIYLPLRSILFALIFRSIKPKIQKYLVALYFIWRPIYQIITTSSRLFANFWRRYPKGIDNPFNTSGCEYLLFVCRCCLHSVAWFSYWFNNLGLITEGNTYCCYAASSLPLWGNTDVVLVNIKRNFWRRCRGDIINIYQVPNHKSHLLAIYIICLCLSFSSPPLHKNLSFYSPSFFVRRFLLKSVLECNLIL